MICQFCGSNESVHHLSFAKNAPYICLQCLANAKMCDGCTIIGIYKENVHFIEGQGFYCEPCAGKATVCGDCNTKFMGEGLDVGNNRHVCSACASGYTKCPDCNKYHQDEERSELELAQWDGIKKDTCDMCLDTLTSGQVPKDVGECNSCSCVTGSKVGDKFYCDNCQEEYNIVNCVNCGNVAHDTCVRNDGKLICTVCAEAHYCYCAYCDKWHKKSDMAKDVRKCCQSCYDTREQCECCATMVMGGELKVVDGVKVCSSCYSDTRKCPACDKRHFKTAAGCCPDCIKKEGLYSQESWRYRAPKFLTRGEGPLFFGIENEMGLGRGVESFGKHLSATFHRNDLYYVYDGSIKPRDTGVEIVCHPRSFDEVYKSNFEEMFKHDSIEENATCGMHVHLSKEAFTRPHLFKFLCFFYEWKTFVEKIAGRKYSEHILEDYSGNKKKQCAEDSGYKEMARKARLKGGQDRYQAINLVPEHTVEVRVFKGATCVEELYKNVEFCDALFHYTKSVKRKEMSEKGFRKFVEGKKDLYRNLTSFLSGVPFSRRRAKKKSVKKETMSAREVLARQQVTITAYTPAYDEAPMPAPPMPRRIR